MQGFLLFYLFKYNKHQWNEYPTGDIIGHWQFTSLLHHTSLLLPPIQDNHLDLVFNMPLLLESRLFFLSPTYRTAAAEVTSTAPVYSWISNCPTFRTSMLVHGACKRQCQFSPQQQVRLYLTRTLFSAEGLQLRLLVFEESRTSGNWGTLIESCNWMQSAQSQIKWTCV